MTHIEKDENPVPRPATVPHPRFDDKMTRRYRVEIIQTQLIDIDVASPPNDTDPQVIRLMANRLMA